MKPFFLLGSEYQLPESSVRFLSDYITRIEKYVAKHHIDEEYLSDIRSRIAEKLDSLDHPIENKDVIKVVNDLGEPEDIFADVVDSASKDEVANSGDIGLLSRKKKIIFGVALRLSEDLKIPVLYVRIAFILLIFAGGAGIWIYLALALLLPRIFHFSGNGFFSQSAIGNLLSGVWKLVRLIAIGFLSVFLLSIAFAFFIGGVTGSVGGINLFGEWVLGGVDVLSFVTPMLRVAVIIASVASILIALGLVAYVFRKPIFGRYSWSFLMLVFIGSCIAMASALPPILRDFSEMRVSDRQSYPLQYSGTGEITIDMPYSDRGPGFWGDFSSISVNYAPTSSGISVDIETILRGGGANSETLSRMNPIQVSLENGILRVKPPTLIFREKVPLTLVEYRIMVNAPKNILVKSPYGDAYNSKRTRLEDFTAGRRECALSRYIYDSEREVFYCDPRGYSREVLDRAMFEYAERFSWSKFRETDRVYPGAVIATGSYTVDVIRKNGSLEPDTIKVSINEKGDIWGERVGSDRIQQ